MVKVVGKDNNVAKQTVCKHCGNILEYFPCEEHTVHYAFDYLGDSESGIGFYCPNCDNVVLTRNN